MAERCPAARGVCVRAERCRRKFTPRSLLKRQRAPPPGPRHLGRAPPTPPHARAPSHERAPPSPHARVPVPRAAARGASRGGRCGANPGLRPCAAGGPFLVLPHGRPALGAKFGAVPVSPSPSRAPPAQNDPRRGGRTQSGSAVPHLRPETPRTRTGAGAPTRNCSTGPHPSTVSAVELEGSPWKPTCMGLENKFTLSICAWRVRMKTGTFGAKASLQSLTEVLESALQDIPGPAQPNWKYQLAENLPSEALSHGPVRNWKDCRPRLRCAESSHQFKDT
ncbi:uncharacterized protein [Excalfactoria chinensis]|uniref:uncharacterized protein n=1 Tax=Excalfactoria chinensis TaxID=46218 RepID=UPI003B3A8344